MLGKAFSLPLPSLSPSRRHELQWFYQEGASYLFPDCWESFVEPIPKVERHDLIGAYYRRLTGSNEDIKLQCARAWSGWEMNTVKLISDPAVIESRLSDAAWALAFARIEW